MKNNYLNRVIDNTLKETLDMSGAVLIEGPKWCGKTTTAMMQSNSVLKLQNPDVRDKYIEMAEIQPSLLLRGETPRLIDEWQTIPILWDSVRNCVDEINKDGLYILTGSTSVNEENIMHSRTGRITRLLMKPMSLFESKESTGEISFYDLFNIPNMDINGVESKLTLEQLIFATCRGGWPDSLNKKTDKAQLAVAYSYVENICKSDASKIDGIKRNPLKVKTILKSYSRNISTLASEKTIFNDVNSNFKAISQPTYHSYVDALTRLFVIDNVPGWSPNIRSSTAIRSGMKKEFVDPSIAVAALGLNPKSLLFDLKTFGFIFENLCMRDLSVYTNAIGGQLSYYHDRYGLESDCVLHLRDDRYCLIEFKLGKSGIDNGAQNLIKLNNIIKDKIKENNLNIKEPEFLAVITGGQFAYTRKDGVKVIPIATLRE